MGLYHSPLTGSGANPDEAPPTGTVSRVTTALLAARLTDLRDRHGAKLIRYGAVSAFNVVFSQTLLYGAQTVPEWSAVASNVFAVSVSAVPAYVLSRYWVWQKRGKNHIMREVVPFWSLTLLGFVLSTVAVWFVAEQWAPPPLVINATNLAAFGVVWVFKFVILDQVLFKHEPPAD